MRSVKTVTEIVSCLRHIAHLDRFDFLSTVHREYEVDAVTGEVLFELLQASAPVQKPSAWGCTCAECGEWQRWTPSGMVCKNGHGGAAGINHRTYTAPPAIRIQEPVATFDVAVNERTAAINYDHRKHKLVSGAPLYAAPLAASPVAWFDNDGSIKGRVSDEQLFVLCSNALCALDVRNGWDREPMQEPAEKPVCQRCGGTGEVDTGSVYPSGDPAYEPCECATPPAPQQTYQPISTAPKDGTAIFVLVQGSDIPMPVRWKDGEWVTTWDGYRVSEFDEPSHWMPIPVLKVDQPRDYVNALDLVCSAIGICP